MNVLDAAPELKRTADVRASSFAARYCGRTVLAIGAHPDDVELGIGGTIALLSRAGVRVVMAIASVPADFEVRATEAQASAAILGCELRLLQDTCCRIEDLKNYQLVALVDKVVKDTRPAAILTHGPTDFHRDHVALYQAVVSAQRLAPFDLYSYGPTMTRPVPVPFQANAYVDITETIDTKLRAIAAHQSQFYSRGLTFEFCRDLARVTGRMVGVDYAEGLHAGKIIFS